MLTLREIHDQENPMLTKTHTHGEPNKEYSHDALCELTELELYSIVKKAFGGWLSGRELGAYKRGKRKLANQLLTMQATIREARFAGERE